MDTDMFSPVPEHPKQDSKENNSIDPFANKEILRENILSNNIKDLDFATKEELILWDEAVDFAEPIKKNIPLVGFVDSLPGVPAVIEGELTPHEVVSERRITLTGLNEDIKEFTDDIHAKRMEMEEQGKFHVREFVYDVNMVRVFGQYAATNEEMAAYFEVDVQTISKLLNDEKSDFYVVFHKAKSLLTLSLRQVQVKTALAGSERVMIHLGKNLLGQGGEAPVKPSDKDISGDGKKRRSRIITLTKQIEEFEVD